jgi:hypothetical protein
MAGAGPILDQPALFASVPCRSTLSFGHTSIVVSKYPGECAVIKVRVQAPLNYDETIMKR